MSAPIRGARKPRSKGGTNRMENLSLACAGCNEAKGCMMPDEFRMVMAGATA